MAKFVFPNLSGGLMNNLMKKAQKFQQQMEDMQNDLQKIEFTSSTPDGAVVAIATGKKFLKKIIIKPKVVDPNNVEMLEDLILTACNEAIKKAEENTTGEMEKLTDGLNIPSL